jgi:outer membrane lipoprotein-sorting protein
MKKTLIYAILALFTTANAFAQQDAQAKAILSQVSAKYKSYDAIKTEFSFTLDNPQAGVKETQTGTLLTRSKANKFRVTLYSKPGVVEQEIISDGKNQWTYLKKDNEVQVNEVDHSGEGLNPAQIFTIYEHGYKYLYIGEQKLNGKIYQLIDLSPTDSKTSFFKIRLTIDKAKKQIYNALLFDKNGSHYIYTISSFTPNVKVTDASFTFDKKDHPGVEVVDLK